MDPAEQTIILSETFFKEPFNLLISIKVESQFHKKASGIGIHYKYRLMKRIHGNYIRCFITDAFDRPQTVSKLICFKRFYLLHIIFKLSERVFIILFL